MDIDPQHRNTLREIELALTNLVGEIADMKEHYSDMFDDLSDEEKKTVEGEYLSMVVAELEDLCDKFDSSIIDVGALLS